MPTTETELTIRNPKRDISNRNGRASWYPYYAGYSLSFVEDALNYARSQTPSRVFLIRETGVALRPRWHTH